MTTCPVCSSTKITSVITNAPLVLKRDCVCTDCRTKWKPALSKTSGVLCLVLGGLLAIGGSAAACEEMFMHHGNLIDLVVLDASALSGLAVVVQGISIVFGRGGKLRILGKVVDPALKPLASAAPDQANLELPPAEKKCPYCGKRFPGTMTECVLDENTLVAVPPPRK
jgi:hypothetical protein